MSKAKHSRTRSLIGFLISFTVFLCALWIIVNKQYIIDQYAVLEYRPTADVLTIANKSSMTDKAKFYFYASKPAVEASEAFNANCERQESNNAILGCYTNKSIHVYNVNNAQLDGIEEVTAVHETLHAIWDRMSDNDRKSVGIMLDAAYARINDANLSSRMDYYARNEPGERLNELHSILGSEYGNLGADLENYYSRYFTDRLKIVAFHANYQTVFDSLKNQSESLYNDIQNMKSKLDTEINQYNDSASSLQSDYNALSATSSSVDLSSSKEVNQYNAKLNTLKTRANQLDQTKTQILSEQNEYNSKISEYNKLVVASNSLNQSVDSTLQPSPSI